MKPVAWLTVPGLRGWCVSCRDVLAAAAAAERVSRPRDIHMWLPHGRHACQ